MDVGLTGSSTPSPSAQAASADKLKRGEESERFPSRDVEGAAPRNRPVDDRVGKIDQLQRMAEEALAADNLKLSIKYDKAAGQFVYRGLDRETGEVVKVYPAEEVLERIAKSKQDGDGLVDSPAGVALDRTL